MSSTTPSREHICELEARIHDMFEGNSAVKLLLDPESGAIVEANSAAAAFYGYPAEELRQLTIMQLNQLPQELVLRELALAREQQRTYFEFKHRLRSGELRDVQVYTSPCEAYGRKLLFSIICDITERNRLAEHLAHAQRMEALGRLAGGVAHDFNNLLAALEMISGLLSARHPTSPEVDELQGLVQRGSGLTRQLLAFCRRQIVRPVLIDARLVAQRVEQLLRRTFDESHTLRFSLPDERLPVKGDPTQLEQVLINLVLNARDATPPGGVITVSLERFDLDPATEQLASGTYVRLRVSDTGAGLTAEETRHIFEPFYTSKGPGKGTGLGLAMVYGVVQQSSGAVWVDSSPGQGATFSVLLPWAGEIAPAFDEEGLPPQQPGGVETILVAEDDPVFRRVVVRLLSSRGYRVIEASDGVEALALARAHRGEIHALLADVIMPEMGGIELSSRLTRERPGLRVLHASGHQDYTRIGLLDAAGAFIAKPFTAAELLSKLRELLDQPPVDDRG